MFGDINRSEFPRIGFRVEMSPGVHFPTSWKGRETPAVGFKRIFTRSARVARARRLR